jgi:DNA-binding response OmpR family regulator
MRSRKVGVPLILLPGFGDEMRAHGGTPAGADLLVSKPLTANSLKTAIASVVKN